MKPEFTTSGIDVQTFNEIYDELAAEYRAIYGADINLDPDSPDGQRVGIEAKARLDLQSFALALYNQLDPNLSSGEFLNKLIKLSGITRRPAVRSQVDVSVTTDRALTLPAGWSVADTLGQSWALGSPVVIASASTVTVTLFAADFGPIEAEIATVVEPETVVIGVTAVTNPAAATVGQDEETDAQLRIRRNRSLANPATSTLGGLFSALGNVSSVTDLQVYENSTQFEDVVRDIAPHTIWAVIDGGAVDDIAETLAKNKTGGAGLKGAVEGTYTESVPLTNDPTFSITHVMAFDRPTAKDLYVRMDVTRKVSASPVDSAAIASALSALPFRIAESGIASGLYSTVYGAGDNFIATDLEISDDGSTWTDGRILAGADGKFSIDAGNVTVTDIT